jgi:hypothetical protein
VHGVEIALAVELDGRSQKCSYLCLHIHLIGTWTCGTVGVIHEHNCNSETQKEGSMTATMGELAELLTYRIPNLPQSFYYIPNFISPSEEQYIQQKAGNSPALHYYESLLTPRRSQVTDGHNSPSGGCKPIPRHSQQTTPS